MTGMRSSLRKRLVLGTWLLLLVALAPPFIYFDRMLRQDMLAEARLRALDSLSSTHWILASHAPFANYHDLSVWAADYARHTGIRFTYLIAGQVVADSDVAAGDVRMLDDHALRPEVQEAGKGGQGIEVRYSTTLKKDLVYAARPVDALPGLPAGIMRVALPVSETRSRLDRMEAGLTWAFVFSLVASGLLGLLVTRPFLNGIEDLARGAQAIGQGDYGRRIRDVPGRELRPLAHAINGMANNIERHLALLEERKGRLEAVFNGMREGVMVLDAEGRIATMNRALTTMFEGMPSKIGSTPLEATMKPGLQRAVDALRAKDTTEGRSIMVEAAGGRAFEVNLVPFIDASGRCMVLVFHDVSEHEKLERMRRDFVANVSHELKTPLTSIKGYAETLLDMETQAATHAEGECGAGKGPSVAFLGTIVRNADHMTKMVNSLLVLARSEHKGEKRVLAPVDAHDVLQQCLREMALAAQAKHIGVSCECAEGIRVMADRDGLVEVFRNLLDNAIKYSPEGTHVSVFARSGPFSSTFRFMDEGSGIPESSKERIFERFYRIEREGEAPKDGSAGLGLAICRRIVKSYGGEIWVESPLDVEKGTGAAFFVTLNTARPVTPDAVTAGATTAGAATAGKREDSGKA